MSEVSPATVLNDFRAIRSFYAWLLDEEELDANPALRLHGPKVAETPVTVATETDYKRLLAVCPKATWAGRRDAAVIGCLWWGGFRRGELAVLDVGHVDLDSAVITIPRTKGGVPRRVPDPPRPARPARPLAAQTPRGRPRSTCRRCSSPSTAAG